MNEKLSLIQKINEAKKRLASETMNKSGKNTFQKYDYFELRDFLPTIIQAEHELGFANMISFPVIDGVVTALLTICDATSNETLSFMSPIADATTKGAIPIQTIGSMHTYMRRYLYIMAYEIAVHDAVDGVDQNTETVTPTQTATNEKQKIITHIGLLIYPNSNAEEKGAPNEFLYEIYAKELTGYNNLNSKIKKLSDLNVDQLKDMEQKMEVPHAVK